MINECNCWLKGLIQGDGYTDERHLEIFNSSESILRIVVISLKRLVPQSRIKIDIYSESPSKYMVLRWVKILKLPTENFTLRKNTSPWKSRTEKIRVRVSSKEFVRILSKKPKHLEAYLRGLFDAEASVDIKGYVEFKQLANEKGTYLVNKVFNILKTLGIEATEVKTKNDRNIKRDAYLYVKDLGKYQNKIGFVDEEKRSKLKIIISAKDRNNNPKVEDIRRLVSGNKGLWDIVKELKSPYHKVRQALKDNHLAVR
jgi:hypothetical protein